MEQLRYYTAKAEFFESEQGKHWIKQLNILEIRVEFSFLDVAFVFIFHLFVYVHPDVNASYNQYGTIKRTSVKVS